MRNDSSETPPKAIVGTVMRSTPAVLRDAGDSGDMANLLVGWGSSIR
jgi:hypothetical protein